MTTPALAQHVKGKGRHYAHPVTGELVPSVTNVISILDKPALPRWAAKMVAERAMVLKHSLPKMEDGDIVDTLKAVPFQRSQRAADRGSDIHEYLECLLNNYATPELNSDAAPYKDAADHWHGMASLEEVHTELTVFHPAYAGTVDFVGECGDTWVIGDFKTSKAIYPEAALQLSALWGCTMTADGEPVPWRDESGALRGPTRLTVVRIGEDRFEEKTVRDAERSLQTFMSLLDAWHWRHEKAYVEDVR